MQRLAGDHGPAFNTQNIDVEYRAIAGQLLSNLHLGRTFAYAEEQEKKTQKVQRFSQDYFDLITKHGKDAAKYLALEGNVAFELGGQTYELVD